ncbi:MAG TPA: dTDP-4-dehydrorhamnose 3,5-epimerase [Patescibacteria group bacterium]|nr:dTDP-4-dehydrorhamnose 3,5-epimerase [Patescibacteria group bacterium]
MNIVTTPLSGLVIIEPQVFADDRGWFFESYNVNAFRKSGIETTFVQDNHSQSKQGVLRGLHFQRPPKAMSKLVRCTRGRVWDVAVDIRAHSNTFKQWFGIELTAENKKMLYIPEGFAHGFYALEDCELVYKCSATFDAALDGSVAWNDAAFHVQWPLLNDVEPFLSEKDRTAPPFDKLGVIFK